MEMMQELREELAQCKADKEFVWSLWKQLQKESPELTAAIDMVTTREKSKREQGEREIALLLLEKDEQTVSLQQKLDTSNEKLAQVISQLEKTHAECATAQDKVLKLKQSIQQEQASNREISARNVALREKCFTLEKSLAQEEQVIKQLQRVEDNKDELCREVSMLSARVRELEMQLAQSRDKVILCDERCNVLNTELKMKTEEIQKLKEEKLQLRKEVDELDSSQQNRSSVESGGQQQDGGDDKAMKLLERLEADLFDTKNMLKLKDKELQILRCSHDKRLERVKWLKTNYTLAVKQLKTYDAQSCQQAVTRKACKRKRRHSENALKHENCQLVWNELTHYKTLYQQMEHNLVMLEEERDNLQAKVCRNQTTISELRSCLHHEKQDLERKIAAIAVLEDSMGSIHLQQQKVDELQCCVDQMHTEKAQLILQISHLEKKCAVFSYERLTLESTIFELQHKLNMKTIQRECKATMTEPMQFPKHLTVQNSSSKSIKQRASSTSQFCIATKSEQVLSSSPLTIHKLDNQGVHEARSSSQSLSPNGTPCAQQRVNTCHHRSYSEGEILLSHNTKGQKRAPNLVPQLTSCPNTKRSSSAVVGRNPRLVVRCVGTQTDSVVARPHNCPAVGKVKRLEQRLQSVLKKLTDEKLSVKSILHSLKEQSSLTEKYKNDLRELGQKIQGYRVSLKAAESERDEAKNCIHRLKDEVQVLEAGSSRPFDEIEAHLRKLEKEKKELQDICLELRSSSQTLKEALQSKETELMKFKKEQEKMERNLKQKRQLIEDYQKKLKLAQDDAVTKDEKTKKLTQDIERCSKLVSQDKQKLQLLKAQLAQQSSDKVKLVSMLEKCQEELDQTIQQMCASTELGEKKLKSTRDCLHSTKCDLDAARQVIARRGTELKEANEVVSEFKLTIQTLADELDAKKAEQKMKIASTRSSIAGPSARARQIAHKALNLTDKDIDDLFSDQVEINYQLHTKNESGLFKSILQVTKNFEPPFMRKLTLQLLNGLLTLNK